MPCALSVSLTGPESAAGGASLRTAALYDSWARPIAGVRRTAASRAIGRVRRIGDRSSTSCVRAGKTTAGGPVSAGPPNACAGRRLVRRAPPARAAPIVASGSEGEAAHEAAAAVRVVPARLQALALELVAQGVGRLGDDAPGERLVGDDLVAAGV